jgi:uncharacterized protein YraI
MKSFLLFLTTSATLLLLRISVSLAETTGTATGTVVVSSGNTLKVHSAPDTAAPTLYSLANGAVVTLECYLKGTTVSGSQGTTDQVSIIYDYYHINILIFSYTIYTYM